MSFGRWILVSVPFGVLNTLIAWVFLVLVMKPDDISSIPIIVYERGTNVFGRKNLAVMGTSLFTIVLFANFRYVEGVFGDIGIVAAVYVAFMFGSGILSEVLPCLLEFSFCSCCYFRCFANGSTFVFV